MGKLNTHSTAPYIAWKIIERFDLFLDTQSREYTCILEVQNLQIWLHNVGNDVVQSVQTNEYDRRPIMYSIIRSHHKTAQ